LEILQRNVGDGGCTRQGLRQEDGEGHHLRHCSGWNRPGGSAGT
jgi:hypothetical protein